jgi:putative membrane protein
MDPLVLSWVAVIALAVGLAVLLVRHSRSDPVRGAAEERLAERYAKGEIEREEYERLLREVRH